MAKNHPPQNFHPYACGAECADGTPCQRGVPYDWMKCYRHRE